MNELVSYIIAIAAGLILGAIFFGGLWLTVKKSMTSKNAALIVIASFILRMGITLLGFYFVGQGSLQRMLFILLGFIVARFMVLRITKSIDAKNLNRAKEVIHES
jgi:F1F0 ATPase subunit 2